MRVGLVGGGGYVGAALAQSDPSITLLPHEDPDPTGYDVVLYFGAGMASRRACQQASWEAVYEANVAGLARLAARMTPSQRLVYASSASVLEGSGPCAADEAWAPTTHDAWPATAAFRELDAYTRSMAERERVAASSPATSVGLRLGTVIGPSPRPRHDLLHLKMARAAVGAGVVTVTDPACWRAVLSMRDLCRAVRAVVSRGARTRHAVYNLCSFNASVGEIADLVAAAFGVKTTLAAGGGAGGFSMDCAAFRRDFGATTLRDDRHTVLECVRPQKT